MMTLSARSQQSSTAHVNIPTVPLCELLKNPVQYSGKTVTTTARITRYKHGTGLWDPACSDRGADLEIQESQRTSSAMLQLDEALRRFGMSDHPIIATLIGTWVGKQHTDNQFIKQPRVVFRCI